MGFQRGRHRTAEDEIRRKTVRFTWGDGETQFLQRAQNFDVNGTGTHAARVDQERARDSQIMLLAILDEGKEAIERIGILVGSQAHDNVHMLPAMRANHMRSKKRWSLVAASSKVKEVWCRKLSSRALSMIVS